jgi:hypothetical protein
MGSRRRIYCTDYSRRDKPGGSSRFIVRTGQVAEWQTRRTQNPVHASECGFESHLGHCLRNSSFSWIFRHFLHCRPTGAGPIGLFLAQANTAAHRPRRSNAPVAPECNLQWCPTRPVPPPTPLPPMASPGHQSRRNQTQRSLLLAPHANAAGQPRLRLTAGCGRIEGRGRNSGFGSRGIFDVALAIPM